MKPSWKDAPEWANWRGRDKNCSWWWYECEPVIRGDRFYPAEGKIERAIVYNKAWKKSLEARQK